jgi:hypothetical protein
MASTPIRSNVVKWERNRGRNATDDPSTLPDDITRETINVMLESVGLGSRRPGVGFGIELLNITGAADHIGSLGFARLYVSPGVFTGFTSGTDRSATPRLIINVNGLGGTGYTIAAADAILSDARFVDWHEFNGKLFFTCQTAVNRLHAMEVFTPIRVGLPAAAAPTMANTGAGAYAATIRYYRIQWHDATTRTVNGNLGTSASFTPSGAGTGVNVTRPAVPAGEDISHWRVWGSSDNINFYDLSGLIVIATTVFFDNVVPSTYFSGRTAAPPEGTNTPWPSVKYLATGAQRMLGFGAWDPNTTLEGMPVIPGRVYFSPVMNTTDADDEERVSNTTVLKGWIDVGQKRQGRIDRGILDPIDDVNLVFQDLGVWGLVPTGNDAAPFRRVRLDPRKGSCGQRSQFIGEDEAGNPCAYFLEPVVGPYRYGSRGFEWLGYEVQEYFGRGTLINQADFVHGIWDPINKCCRWWVACDENDEPTVQGVFFPRHGRSTGRGEVRGGWVIHDGLAGQWVCACVGIADNWGADDNSNIVIGGLADGIAPTTIACLDNSANTYDNPSPDPLAGTAFVGYLESKALSASVPQVITQMGQSYVQGRSPGNGALIAMGVLRDFAIGVLNGQSNVSLSSTSPVSRVLRKFASLEGLTNMNAFQAVLQEAARVSTLHVLNTPGTHNLVIEEEGLLIADCIGGGGGARSATQLYSQAGGGGGGYAAFGPTWVTVGQTIVAVVGAAGAANTDGGESSLTLGGSLLIRATGGGSGIRTGGVAPGLQGGAGGQGVTGAVLYNGGDGGNGANNINSGGGGGGGAAGFSGAGVVGVNGATPAPGAGGAGNGGLPGGVSGAGGNGGANNVVGSAGSNYGGGAGGNGSSAAASGSSGGVGVVRYRIFPGSWTLDRWLSSFETGAEA